MKKTRSLLFSALSLIMIGAFVLTACGGSTAT